jgi:hypothetical protein
MAVNGLRRVRRRAPGSDPRSPGRSATSLAIGEINQTVFDCPVCSRPLAMGTHRCPACRTRLVNGVPLVKASMFAIVGLAAGLAIGVVSAGSLGIGGPGSSAGRGANGNPGASVAPGASTIAVGATPTPLPVATEVPLISRTAIVQAVTVNGRLAASSRALATALARKPFDAAEVAQTLRTISAESVYATELAGIVSDWPGTSGIGTKLTDLYGTVHDSAAHALVASVRNQTAYRDAARAMVATLAGLVAVDAEIRAVAAARGITVPASLAP